MATPDWIANTEQIIGASHPTLADTKNRCGQTIQTMLEVEHSTDGIHSIRATRLVGEIDTFSGNGAARTITLSNSGLTPKKVVVWEAYTGTNLCSNGGFDSDTTGWTAVDCTLASVAGGQAGNCLEVTRTGGTKQYAYYTLTGLQIGRKFPIGSISLYVKSGTSGDEAFNCYIGTSPGGGGSTIGSGTTTGAWVQYSNSQVITVTAGTMYLHVTKNTATAGTMLFDTIVIAYGYGEAPLRLDSMDQANVEAIRGRDSTIGTYPYGIPIDNFQTGSFDVGQFVNGNGLTNYYLVLGIDEDTTYTGDGGAAGSDPTWMTSGNLTTAPMIGSDDATVSQTTNSANAVESEIWTLFIEEHTVAGAHSITIESAIIECNKYSATAGADDRTITLENSNLQIAYLFVFRNFDEGMHSCSASMTADNTKIETTAAFQADYIQDISTAGQFTVGSSLNSGAYTYYYCAIGLPT